MAAAAGAGSFLLSAKTSDSKLIMVTQPEAERMRRSAAQTHAILATLADKALKAGPWSVTFHRPAGVGAGAGPNDYFSEGPYLVVEPG